MGLVLDSLRAATAPLEDIGGKAMGLARLVDSGARVPPWFVVTANAFAAHYSNDTEALEPPGMFLSEAITSALTELGEGPYAVRSSMVGEDSESHSFAGQLETFLYQRDAKEVIDSVHACWRSALSDRVIDYRDRAGLASNDLRVAVIVQRMITGEVSGVLFTADPVENDPETCLLTAAWGLGEGVVSGLCNTDEFRWSHSGSESGRALAEKDIRLVARPDGSPGTMTEAVPQADRERACLTDEQVETICNAGLSIAGALGAPQDIEWTLSGGRLFLLQSRPITTLDLTPRDTGPRVVWDNSNIQESYCGVTTPLTFSFASAAYASVYRQTMEALRIPSDVIADHEGMLRNMLGLIRGRIYYNINNWYRGLLLLPSFGRNKDDMERMMGLDVHVDFIEDQVLSTGEKLVRAPRLVGTLLQLRRRFSRLERDVPRFLEDFETAYQRVDRTALAKAPMSELIDTLAQLDRDMLENWSVPIINDFYVMMSMGRLRRLVVASGRDEDDVIINNLMSGEEGIESTEPTRVLMRLAREARGNPDALSALTGGSQRDALEAFRAEHPDLSAEIDRYIERYGDRVMGELKLETVSLREDPDFVIDVLRNFAARDDLDPDALEAREKSLRSDAEATLRKELPPLKRGRLRGVLSDARRAVAQRENMRLARTRMFGLYRDVYRAIGSRLSESEKLPDGRDVFYLTTDEIRAYFEGRSVGADLAALTAARKAEFAAYEAEELPHHFETMGAVYHGNDFRPPAVEAIDPDAETLTGKPCFPGQVEARARVIMNPKDDLSVNGQILVTVRTDPGWAPLFPTASGILVERGSTLSHSAVLARELGIPAIVGVPGLTRIVHDGESLRMDGGTGVVQRCS